MLSNTNTPAPGPWLAVQCAAIGRGHRQEAGGVCQDKTCVCTEHGVCAVALADGAGSAALSHLGAACVTDTVCRLLCRRFGDYLQTDSATEVRREILDCLLAELDRLAARQGCTRADLASTLLAVAMQGDRYLYLHIGDGVIGYTKNGRVRVASAPSNGEFCNTTFFVTSPHAAEHMAIGKGRDAAVDGFVLMSDGTQASLYSRRDRSLAPVLARLIGRLSVTSPEYMTPSIQSSLEDVICPRTRDDCSLVLAARADRTCADLSDEELNDYFEIDTQHLKEWQIRLRRQRYLSILRALDQDSTDEELARKFRLRGVGHFVKKWLNPLVDLGYVEMIRPHLYHRTVGSPEPRAQSPEPIQQEGRCISQ